MPRTICCSLCCHACLFSPAYLAAGLKKLSPMNLISTTTPFPLPYSLPSVPSPPQCPHTPPHITSTIPPTFSHPLSMLSTLFCGLYGLSWWDRMEDGHG